MDNKNCPILKLFPPTIPIQRCLPPNGGHNAGAGVCPSLPALAMPRTSSPPPPGPGAGPGRTAAAPPRGSPATSAAAAAFSSLRPPWARWMRPWPRAVKPNEALKRRIPFVPFRGRGQHCLKIRNVEKAKTAGSMKNPTFHVLFSPCPWGRKTCDIIDSAKISA